MNILVSKKFNDVGGRELYKNDFVKLEVEGAKELGILCPISKLTGFPMSLQEAVMYISDKNVRIADALLQVLPTIPSDDSISDDEKMSMLISRLDSGSFAENDKVAEVLGQVAKQFFPDAKVDKVVEEVQQKIDFSNTETLSDNA